MIRVEIKFNTIPRFGHTFEDVQYLLRNKLQELIYEMEGDYVHTQFLISEVTDNERKDCWSKIYIRSNARTFC